MAPVAFDNQNMSQNRSGNLLKKVIEKAVPTTLLFWLSTLTPIPK